VKFNIAGEIIAEKLFQKVWGVGPSVAKQLVYQHGLYGVYGKWRAKKEREEARERERRRERKKLR
jgi:hypothetical protein